MRVRVIIVLGIMLAGCDMKHAVTPSPPPSKTITLGPNDLITHRLDNGQEIFWASGDRPRINCPAGYDLDVTYVSAAKGDDPVFTAQTCVWHEEPKPAQVVPPLCKNTGNPAQYDKYQSNDADFVWRCEK